MTSFRLGHINDAVLALWIHRNGLISHDLLPKMKNKCHCYIIVFNIKSQAVKSNSFSFWIYNISDSFFVVSFPFLTNIKYPRSHFITISKAVVVRKSRAATAQLLWEHFLWGLIAENLWVLFYKNCKRLWALSTILLLDWQKERVTVVVEGSHFAEYIEFISWLATHIYVHS